MDEIKKNPALEVLVSSGSFRSVVIPIGGCLLTAAAIVCAQPPIAMWWVAPVALVPWLGTARTSWVGLLASGLAWGTLSGLGMGYWTYTGLKSLGASTPESGFGLLTTALVVTGIPGSLYGAGAALAIRATHPWRGLLFALIVALIDFLRGVPQLWLPWSLLGHSQSNALGVAQLALVGGVPWISGLLAGTSYCIAQSRREIDGGRRGTWVPWICVYLALLALGLPLAEHVRGPDDPGTEARRIVVVQPRIPPGDRWSESLQKTNIALLGRRTLEAVNLIEHRVDVIFWPETSVTVPLANAPQLATELGRWINRFRSPLVLGGVSPGRSASLYRNSAIWLDASGQVVDRFDKTLAVPIVERSAKSAIEARLQSAFGAGSIRRYAEEGGTQRPLRGEDSYAVAMCFEVIYPSLVSARLDPETIAIVNLANDAWYGSSTPGAQQLAFASFRAIENRRHLIRVADSGPSAVLDPFGRVVRQLNAHEAGTLNVEFMPSSGPRSVERAAILGTVLLTAGLGLAVQRFVE